MNFLYKIYNKNVVFSQCIVYGLFMHFCDLNHEIAQMQQEEKE